ncbi:MAG: hypothetical protein JWR74_1852 [Polaromonas sp.]|nr:hypothetical protein [Polaromonas sp.]
MAILIVPSALRRYSNQQARISLMANTVQELLERFTNESSELRNFIFSGSTLRKFVIVSKNGQDIRLLDGLLTPVGASDEVHVVAGVAGG